MLRDFLIDCDVRKIFGVPGYANHPVFLATMTRPGIDCVLTKHEAAAAWMAYGYALSTGKFGVCSGTSGAGTTNLVSGVVSSYYNSVPLLVITGQVEKTKFGKGAFQELTGTGTRSVSAMEIFAPMTKLNLAVNDADQLPSALSRAYEALTTGRRGPVHLSIPIDTQKTVVNGAYTLKVPERQERLSQRQLSELAGMLADAKAPLLLFGRGCRNERELATAFAEKLGVPFCTTMQAKGLVAACHELNYGLTGIAGSPRANHYLTEACDLLVCLGTSLNEFTTGGYRPEFGANKKLVHVDLDEREFDKNYRADLKIHADCAELFAAVLASDKFGHAPSEERRRVYATFAEIPLEQPVTRDREDGNRITPMDIMDLLEEGCPDDTVFVADSGNNAVWTVHYLQTRRGQDFQIDINTGCMASGVISCIGSKLARPERPVVSICGDGGFMMAGFEAATAADYDVPVLWVVMNDGKLGMVRQGGVMKFNAYVADEYKNCDIAATAATMGLATRVVETVAEFKDALRTFFADQKPTVLDVRFNDRYLPSVYARVRKAQDDQTIQVERKP
jgi:acetolactate synthase-1/2/3 large subunit